MPLRQVDWETLEPYDLKDIAEKKQRDELKASILFEKRGFCKEGGEFHAWMGKGACFFLLQCDTDVFH